VGWVYRHLLGARLFEIEDVCCYAPHIGPSRIRRPGKCEGVRSRRQRPVDRSAGQAGPV
jgi:hypothetical protein